MYKLVTEGTVDEGIYDIGLRKTALINSVLAVDSVDGKPQGVSDDKVCDLFTSACIRVTFFNVLLLLASGLWL